MIQLYAFYKKNSLQIQLYNKVKSKSVEKDIMQVLFKRYEWYMNIRYSRPENKQNY